MHRRHLQQIGLTTSNPPVEPPDEVVGYPRPLLRRREWTSLNGTWDFALDPLAAWQSPRDVEWGASILVPFAPETPRSGVVDTSLYKACWYRRSFELAAPVEDDEQLLLHFGAVDHDARVWVDGVMVGSHQGGYTPFELDVTEALATGAVHEVIVRAYDDPGDLTQPRGKQDWQLQPHSIWYPRTTGIWQTVWLERVPRTRIARLRWTASLDRWEIGLDVRVLGCEGRRMRIAARLRVGDILLVSDQYLVVAGEVHRQIAFSDPGIDDFRNELLWSPESPRLIDAELTLLDDAGLTIDAVTSYTALRSIAVQGDRFLLNGRPYPLRLVLDQGYWPETGMTPPDDASLRKDIELAQAMGFNGVRKHQKIEDPRYLYWADRLGLLVWEEMPSAYRFMSYSVDRLVREWMDVLRRDASHPCIVAWVPINESWGVPNLANSSREREYVQALYHLTRTLDPTRPVVGNDGWESVSTDIIGIHDYEADPKRLARRYSAYAARPELLKRERPGGRILVLQPKDGIEPPVVLSEFGGIALAHAEDRTVWGYSAARDADDLRQRYEALMAAVHGIELLSGFCYTQFADTYQEANGLLYADRTPKFPLADIAAATRGGPPAHEHPRTERERAP